MKFIAWLDNIGPIPAKRGSRVLFFRLMVRKMNAGELCELSGVDRTELSQMESGYLRVDKDAAIRFSKALNVDFNYFYDGEDESKDWGVRL